MNEREGEETAKIKDWPVKFLIFTNIVAFLNSFLKKRRKKPDSEFFCTVGEFHPQTRGERRRA